MLKTNPKRTPNQPMKRTLNRKTNPQFSTTRDREAGGRLTPSLGKGARAWCQRPMCRSRSYLRRPYGRSANMKSESAMGSGALSPLPKAMPASKARRSQAHKIASRGRRPAIVMPVKVSQYKWLMKILVQSCIRPTEAGWNYFAGGKHSGLFLRQTCALPKGDPQSDAHSTNARCRNGTPAQKLTNISAPHCELDLSARVLTEPRIGALVKLRSDRIACHCEGNRNDGGPGVAARALG